MTHDDQLRHMRAYMGICNILQLLESEIIRLRQDDDVPNVEDLLRNAGDAMYEAYRRMTPDGSDGT